MGSPFVAPEDTSLAQLICQAQHGSALAATDAEQHLRPLLSSYIASRFDRRLRRFMDIEDVLQETLLEIFTTAFSESILSCPRILRAYLLRIAQNNLNDAFKRAVLSQRRDFTRETCIGASADHLISAGSSPDIVAQHNEIVETTLPKIIATLHLRRQLIARMILAGEKNTAISYTTGTSLRSVERLAAWLFLQVEHLLHG